MKKILIVDDNPLNIKVLIDSLAGYEYELLTVNTGERALKAAGMALPNLILLDINLPGINGFEVCQQLKSNPITQNIPVIFLSALDDAESKITGFKVGGCDYITKPFHKEEVVARVETQMKIHDLKDDLFVKNEQMSGYLNYVIEMKNQLTITNSLLLDSINYAKRIQSSILPHHTEINSYFPDNFIFYSPKSIVSGDFYFWYSRTNYTFIIGADCTGHGVPGALMSILGATFLDKIIRDKSFSNPSAILYQLEKEVKSILKQDMDDNSKDGMDITVCVLDNKKDKLLVSSAKRPFIIKNKGVLSLLKGVRHSIGGVYDCQANFVNHEFDIQTGDAIYLFTDGYTDQFGGPNSKKFQLKQFFSLIETVHEEPMNIQKQKIESTFWDWKGDIEQTDDVMVFGIKF